MADDPHAIDRFAAFRSWRAEQKGGTYPFPAFGSEWEVPARMPARLWLWVVSMKAAGRGPDEMNEDDALDLLRVAIPPDVFAGWGELPISVEEMLEAAQGLVQYYMGNEAESPGEPEAVATTPPPPNPSSSIGDLSKQTSPASTDSTLPPPWRP